MGKVDRSWTKCGGRSFSHGWGSASGWACASPTLPDRMMFRVSRAYHIFGKMVDAHCQRDEGRFTLHWLVAFQSVRVGFKVYIYNSNSYVHHFLELVVRYPLQGGILHRTCYEGGFTLHWLVALHSVRVRFRVYKISRVCSPFSRSSGKGTLFRVAFSTAPDPRDQVGSTHRRIRIQSQVELLD